MPALTLYQLRPDLYAYNSVTRKHQLKSGKSYKKAYAADPTIFTESTVMLHPPTTAVAVPELPEVKAEPVAKAEPLPEVKKNNGAREQVKSIIQAEIKQNPTFYAGKPVEDLNALFRTLLIEKLTSARAEPSKLLSSVNQTTKLTKPSKPAAKAKKQPLFKLRKPVTSEDEDGETEEETEHSDE